MLVKLADLRKQMLSLSCIQLVPECQKMALVVLFEHFFYIFVSLLSTHIQDFELKTGILHYF